MQGLEEPGGPGEEEGQKAPLRLLRVTFELEDEEESGGEPEEGAGEIMVPPVPGIEDLCLDGRASEDGGASLACCIFFIP